MTIEQLESYSPGHWFYDVRDQLKQHIYRRSERAFAAGDAARDAVTTLEALKVRQQAARTALLDGIGGLPPSDTPLNPRIVGTVTGNGFRIEKVIFESRPKHYVTANLYLPDGLSEPRGAVLFVCGHHLRAKHEPEYQSVCQYLVHAGLIVLAHDPIGQGERFSYYEPALNGTTVSWGTYEHDYAGAQCLPLGDGIARYFLHDSMRAIDYLCSRPEVDPKRIGITGNSGGGTQSSLMMLAEPRLAAAAPGTFIMNRATYMQAGGAQDAEQIWPAFTANGFDHEDIVLNMCPRPVCVLAVTGDFFPIEGTRRTVQRCQRFWEQFGNRSDLELVEDTTNHYYTPKLARAAARFFARHLLDRDHTPDDSRIAPFPPEQLWCTTSGQARGEIEDAVFAQTANGERLAQIEEERKRAPLPERRERALDWLKAKVFRDRKPCDLNPRYYGSDRLETLMVEMAIWWAQEGIFSNGYLFRDFAFAGQNLPVTLAIWDGGTSALRPHWEWIRQTCAAGRAALILDVSGSGGISPRSITQSAPDAFYGVLHKLGTDLLWLDDDLASLRTYDTLRALDMIAVWPGLDATDIRVYASGREGVYGILAAALDERIQQVEAVNGLTTYADWVRARHYVTNGIYSVILRGALRHFDLDELPARFGT